MQISVPAQMFLPEQFLKYFEVTKIAEKKNEWQFTLTEKKEMIPLPLKDKEVVLNGFLKPVEVRDFPIRGRSSYLKFIRRRWKEAGTGNSYQNEYEFHPEGMKATQEFGNFLKGFSREEADILFGDR